MREARFRWWEPGLSSVLVGLLVGGRDVGGQT